MSMIPQRTRRAKAISLWNLCADWDNHAGRKAQGHAVGKSKEPWATCFRPVRGLRGTTPTGGNHLIADSTILSLKKHPTVTFQVFHSIATAMRIGFGFGQNVGAGILRPFVMAVHVFNVNQHSIDNP